MNSFPLVSIVILSYNRENDLKRSLLKIDDQIYSNIEIIVVDNASTDGSCEMVNSLFKKVSLIQLKNNIGIQGWNVGIQKATGKYILVLDDDSYPAKESILRGVEYFDENPDAGIIAFNIYNTNLQHYETKDFPVNPSFFIGCGAMIRRELFGIIGLYNPQIFIDKHEFDFSARCYEAGYKIVFKAELIVFHEQTRNTNKYLDDFNYSRKFRYSHQFKSHSIFIIQNFYFRFSFHFIIKLILNKLIVAVACGFMKEYFKTLFEIIKLYPEIVKNRRVLRPEVQALYQWGNLEWLDRTYFGNYSSKNAIGKNFLVRIIDSVLKWKNSCSII